MSRFQALAGLVLALGVILGCSPAAGGPSDPAALSPSTPITGAEAAGAPAGLLCEGQRSGNLMVWLSSAPSPPAGGVARIETTLRDDRGAPVSGATVGYDIDMTNMSHGEYLVSPQPVADGRYAGEVHFSMPGPWRVIVTVQQAQQPVVRLRFAFRVAG